MCRVGVMELATYHLKTVMTAMASYRIEDLDVTLLLKPSFSILTPAYISGDPGTGLSLKARVCSQSLGSCHVDGFFKKAR